MFAPSACVFYKYMTLSASGRGAPSKVRYSRCVTKQVDRKSSMDRTGRVGLPGVTDDYPPTICKRSTCAPPRVEYIYAENMAAFSAGALSEEQLLVLVDDPNTSEVDQTSYGSFPTRVILVCRSLCISKNRVHATAMSNGNTINWFTI